MREEQWIPLGLVTVPRPCKRGVIGLVDAGQEFNRQEGSLQMFTDSMFFLGQVIHSGHLAPQHHRAVGMGTLAGTVAQVLDDCGTGPGVNGDELIL